MSRGLDTGQWHELGELFDRYSELPVVERGARLSALRARQPELAERLSAMLAADLSGDGLLDRSLDEVAPELHAQLHDTDGATCAGQAMGRYRLVSPLGSGGMGEVWLAERADGEYRQNVALKLLKRGMDTQAILRRFLQERSILARLTHPNIVRLLDGGMSLDDRPYYAMEHVDGQPVVQYAAAMHLGVRERVALVATIADAVSYAHAQLVVHRDLKPSNILVDAKGVPHLLDFGIAKLLEDTGEATLTGTQMRVMSPAYAAPEQILGQPVGTATDVYSLGIVLFELLTGRLPHRRTSRDPAAMAAELGAETERASQMLAKSSTPGQGIYGDADGRRLARLVSGDLDLIVARATHRDPARRYPTMAAFADDLRRWLDGRPIVARPDSARYRAATFVRRHRIGVTAATAAILALMLGLGMAVWQAGEARQQAARAERQAVRAERVKEFLISLFQQNDPANARGEVLTATRVMSLGADNLSTLARDDPQIAGELFVAIAEIQYNLGDAEAGLTNVERGLALMTPVVGPADLRLAQAYYLRGKLYAGTDHPADAETNLRRARSILEQNPDASPERIDAVDEGLASVLRHTRNSVAAAALQREVVARSERRHGPGSLVVAERRVWLALLLEDNGEYAEAEAAYRTAVPILEREKGLLDPSVCKAQATFAGLLDRLGKAEEAADYFERALAGLRQVFGEDSAIYGSTIFSRGIHRLGRRRHVDAEADFRAAILAHGDAQPRDAGHDRRYLGQALMGQQRYAEAADEYQRAESLYRQADVPNDVQRWRARSDYGYAIFRIGRAEEGRQAVVAAIAGMREIIGKDDVVQMRPLMALGEILREQGDIPGALAAHREWRALALSTYGEGAPEDMQSGYHLTLDLLARGTPDDVREAKALIDHVLAAARASQTPLIGDYVAAGEQVDVALAALPTR